MEQVLLMLKFVPVITIGTARGTLFVPHITLAYSCYRTTNFFSKIKALKNKFIDLKSYKQNAMSEKNTEKYAHVKKRRHTFELTI